MSVLSGQTLTRVSRRPKSTMTLRQTTPTDPRFPRTTLHIEGHPSGECRQLSKAAAAAASAVTAAATAASAAAGVRCRRQPAAVPPRRPRGVPDEVALRSLLGAEVFQFVVAVFCRRCFSSAALMALPFMFTLGASSPLRAALLCSPPPLPPPLPRPRRRGVPKTMTRTPTRWSSRFRRRRRALAARSCWSAWRSTPPFWLSASAR